MKVTRSKIWWVVYVDVTGLPGKLLYREVVKARHPQWAIAKACQNLRTRLGLAEGSDSVTFDGPGTSVSLLPGTEKQDGFVVGKTWENRDLPKYLTEHLKTGFKPNRTGKKLSQLPLGRVKPDWEIQRRIDREI